MALKQYVVVALSKIVMGNSNVSCYATCLDSLGFLMANHSLRRIDPARNMRRFYELSFQPTLFGDMAVIRHWGRIGAAGQSKETWFADADHAAVIAERIVQQKRRRGYAEPGTAI